MLRRISRRALVKGALAGSALSLGAWLPPAARAQTPLKSGILTPGILILLTDFILTNRLDEKHGLKFAPPQLYSTLTTAFGDFVNGAHDIAFGSWDTYAARYLAGVPLQLLGSFATAHLIHMLAPANGVKSVAELKGKILAAPMASGTYAMTKAAIREFEGIELEKDIQVQTSDNPMAPLSMLMADRADAALSWETSVTAAMLRRPDLKVIYNVGDVYRTRTGRDLPYFAVLVRKEVIARDPAIGEKLDGVFRDCIAGINADTPAAIASAGKNTYLPPELLNAAFGSGRLRFSYLSTFEPAGREAFMSAGDFMARNGILPRKLDAGIFVGGRAS